MAEKAKMKICPACLNNSCKEVPLIYTFAFPGAEYWCPYCGYTCGIMGPVERAAHTDELEAALMKYREISEDYRRASGRLYAVGTEHEGKVIKPCDLPEDEKRRDREAIEAWQYGQEV